MLDSKDIRISFLKDNKTHSSISLHGLLQRFEIDSNIKNNNLKLEKLKYKLSIIINNQLEHIRKINNKIITSITIYYKNEKVKRLKLNNNIDSLVIFLIALFYNSWKIYLKLNCPYDNKLSKILIEGLLDSNSCEIIYKHTYDNKPFFNNILFYM